jgi:acyl-CoA synthetase (AMP-forming)/AMP-acid ligase II
MRTGDEAVFRKGRNGHEHLFIVDRIKELIKVKVRLGSEGPRDHVS